MYYVVTLMEKATGHFLDVKDARLTLHDMRFPLMCWAWNQEFVEKGHPWNRGVQ
ncbi:hypothetical protein [Streptomyces sp. NPDC059072]|uniref:hypothetical protein n=1 Tax=unclassified Streptomyces TaxID=2593676 RepID=UPI00368C948C